MSVYEQTYSDEWFHVPRDVGVDVACCDCSLVHNIRVRERHGRIQIRMDRSDRKTAALRRASKRKK